MTPEQIAQIMDSIVTFGVALIGIIGSVVLMKVRAYVSEKLDSTTKQNAWSAIESASKVVVDRLEKEMVPAIRLAAADGKISKEEALKLRDMGIDLVKSLVGDGTIRKYQDIAGLGDADVKELIASMIENKVLENSLSLLRSKSQATSSAE